MEVVASLRTGREAVSQLERADPDVVVLDIDMPEMDGIAALPLLLAKKRDLDRHHGVDADAPERRDQLARAVARRHRLHSEAASNREVAGVVEFHRDLIEKIRHLGLRARSRRQLHRRRWCRARSRALRQVRAPLAGNAVARPLIRSSRSTRCTARRMRRSCCAPCR